MFHIATVFVALVGLSAANWELYKKVHGKSYSHVEESFRRQLFDVNVAKINAHNLRYDLGLTTYRMRLSRFTDIHSYEFARFKGLNYNASNDERTGQRFAHEQIIADLPKSVDWRTQGYVTPVKDQGQCGSCWAFSTTGSLEGQHFKKTGKLVSLSEQNLIDCSAEEGNEGCKGGLMDRAFAYVKKNRGLDTEDSYPYEAKEEACQFDPKSIGTSEVGYFDIESGNEEALQKAVATIGPISIAIDASHESFRHYSDGIYDEPLCSSQTLDHGVLVVGYGTENGHDYWLVKNSWGAEMWGDEGYIKMARNKNNQCGIASAASYPTV